MTHPALKDLESEKLFFLSEVGAWFKKMTVDCSSAHRPESIPVEQI
jgi:hypothetical protein